MGHNRYEDLRPRPLRGRENDPEIEKVSRRAKAAAIRPPAFKSIVYSGMNSTQHHTLACKCATMRYITSAHMHAPAPAHPHPHRAGTRRSPSTPPEACKRARQNADPPPMGVGRGSGPPCVARGQQMARATLGAQSRLHAAHALPPHITLRANERCLRFSCGSATWPMSSSTIPPVCACMQSAVSSSRRSGATHPATRAAHA